MTIQEDLQRKSYEKVTYQGKRYDLSCFEDCGPKEATFRLDQDGIIFWVANARNAAAPFPGIYFRFKNGEVLDLIREVRHLDQDIKELSKKLEEKENKLIEMRYARKVVIMPGEVLTLVSRDKEWLSSIDSIGAIYTKGPKGAAFLIGGEI